MATIQDVAKLAGVAPITVSRALSSSGYVAGETRARIEAAAAELGYLPNALARSLRSRRTQTLALVLSDLSNPFFTEVARGVEEAAAEAGYLVILCSTGEQPETEARALRMLLQRRVDGVLLAPARGVAEPVSAIRAQGTAVVVLGRRAEDAGVDGVCCDSEGGAYALGKLLLSLGHRSLAMLAGPAGVSTADDRVAGWTRALSEAGLGGACPVYRGDLTQPSGSGLALRAMGGLPHPTAIFAANNMLASGALNALRQGGRRVPEEVALVGFDDLPTALLADPFLTVATQPAHAMGRRAVELLLDRLQGRPPDEPRQVVLPTEVVVRRSSGSPVRTQSTVGGGFPVVRPPRA